MLTLLKDRVIMGCFVIKDRVMTGCFMIKDRVIMGYFMIKDRVINPIFYSISSILANSQPLNCMIIL